MLLPLFVISILLTASQPPDQQGEQNGQTGIGFLAVLVLPLYSSLMHRYWHGQTLGKRVLGIRVLRYDGGEISLGQSFGR